MRYKAVYSFGRFAEVFRQWEQDFRANPEKFDTPEHSAEYFVHLLDQCDPSYCGGFKTVIEAIKAERDALRIQLTESERRRERLSAVIETQRELLNKARQSDEEIKKAIGSLRAFADAMDRGSLG